MDNSKRNLTKALGIAGVGAAVWKKPVVDSVSLPAHAAMTGVLFSGEAMDLMEVTRVFRKTPEAESDGVLDVLLPRAYAGHDLPGSDRLIMCVWVSGSQVYLTVHRIEERCEESEGDPDTMHYLYEGSGELDSDIGPLSIVKSRVQSDHPPELLPVIATVSSLVPDVSVDITVKNTGDCDPCGEFNYTLDLSDMCEEVDFDAGSFECGEEP